MKDTDDAVAQIKARADIVSIIGETIELRKSGSRHVGLCPFHGEKTPSFSVSAGGQYFHCFGCLESGDVFSYVMKYYSLSFPEALKMLAERCGVELPERKQTSQQKAMSEKRKKMFSVNAKVAGLFTEYLNKNSGGDSARQYLKNRSINSVIAGEYGLGYAPSTDSEGWHFLGKHLTPDELELAAELGLVAKKENGGYYDRFRDRVLFPIQDLSGRVCGFGGRIIGEGQPKYMNSPDSMIYNKSELLLGLYQASDAIRREKKVIFVEGNFDLISLAAAGIKNVVAPLGTALTREQIRLTKRFADSGLVLFDGDLAGVKAAVRSVPMFLAEHLPGQVALLPEGEDPDTYIRTNGSAGMNDLLQIAKPLPEFAFDYYVEQYGLSLDGKTQIIEELKPLVKAASSTLQRSVIVSHFAEKLNLDVGSLEKNLVAEGAAQIVKPEIIKPKVKVQRATHRIEPLTKVQASFVKFMVLNPDFFGQLMEIGIRSLLEGSLGEIIFLQMESMQKTDNAFEPEELMAALPAGAERQIVSEFLLAADESPDHGDAEKELVELEEFLGLSLLKDRRSELDRKLQSLNGSTDIDMWQELMKEKMEVDAKLQDALEGNVS